MNNVTNICLRIKSKAKADVEPFDMDVLAFNGLL
jgi:hypothetical protein